MDCTVRIVSRNIANQSDFVEFRDSRNFAYLEKTGVGQHMASHVGHTWKTMWVTHGKPCVTMHYHAPIPCPTRLADPNRFPGHETIYWDSLPDFFFL